eukprot:295400-Pyramimonas_sp.AAC.1
MTPKVSRKQSTLERLVRLGRVLVFYDLADNYWHERVLLEPLAGTRWIVVTPHFDLHDEDLDEASDLRPVGPRGGIGTVYGSVLRIDMDEFEMRQPELLRAAR